MERDQIGCLLIDAGEREVHEWHVVPRSEHSRHSFARGKTPGDECLGKRPLTSDAPESIQLVIGQKTCRCKKVGDELGVDIDSVENMRSPAAGGGLFVLLLGRAGWALRVHASIPRMRYRRQGPKP